MTFSDGLGSRLIFLISLPRSGSTLLQRILGGHPDIATLAEPWIMLHPLYALKRSGVEAEYDADLARDALDDFLSHVEGGESAYYDAVRKFGLELYERALKSQGRRVFVDKTPRYYRIIPEIRRTFPAAKFVFLLRNPLAVLSSTLRTWFEGQPRLLQGTTNHRDLLDGPKLLSSAIKELGDDAIVVRYEQLIDAPEQTVARLCDCLGLDFVPSMLDYGQNPIPPGRFGDQVGVPQHSRATNEHGEKWIEYLADDSRYDFAADYLKSLDADIALSLGYDVSNLERRLVSMHACHAKESDPRVLADRVNAEGEEFYHRGDLVNARLCFERARDIDPRFSTACNNLLVLHWEAGQTEQALDCLADGLRDSPDDRDLIINGTGIMDALGLPEEAKKLRLQYLQRHPEDMEIGGGLSVAPPNDEPVMQMFAVQESSNPDVSTQTDTFPGSQAITIATSIAPKGIKKQQRAVASWLAVGFRVASLNTPEEITKLRRHFPDVEFLPASRNGKQLAGKPYVFLDDVLVHLYRSGSRVCGIVNSDIILDGGAGLAEYLWHQAAESLVYGSRVDIQTAEERGGCLYHRGFDYFFFDREVIPRLPKTNFMLGVPWWDYWMPIGFERAGVPIKRLDSRIAFHVWHHTNYSAELLIKFGREFAKCCAGSSFLTLYEQSEHPFGNAAFSVLADSALDYVSCHTNKITSPSSPGTEPPHKDAPRVSAIVSTYKSAGFIGECLADLTGQTIADRLEIIVIDANSPEDEASIVEDYRRRFPQTSIRYHRTSERIGVYAAWNLAVRMATGDYLISCSTNDRLRRDACEILARALDEQPDVALVYGNSFMTQRPHQRFDAVELCSLYLWPDFRYEDLVDRCMVGPHPMWRRDVHERIGYFDERYVALGDQEFWLRLGEHERLLNIPDFTGVYFVSEDSITGNADVAQAETDAVHAHYQWRYRYSKWQRLTEQRQVRPTSTQLPSVHVVVLVPPGGLERAADTLDALGLPEHVDLRLTVVADQSPPDTGMLNEPRLEWICYTSPKQVPSLVCRIGERTEAEWMFVIDAGDQLLPAALADAMAYAAERPVWQMIYFDDDRRDAEEKFSDPRFKPDFNLALLRCQPYLGSCFMIRSQSLVSIGGFGSVAAWRSADAALRLVDRYGADVVGHISRIMVHYIGDSDDAWGASSTLGEYRNAVMAHLQRRGIDAEVVPGQTPTLLHVRRNRKFSPLISIILNGGKLEEQRLALQTVLTKTSYPHFEVLLLEVEQSGFEMPQFPGDERVRRMPCGSAPSAIELNDVAQQARGEFLIWLDGRSVVLQSEWIDRLLSQFVDDDIAVVSARLIDRRKTVLDGGIVLGLGTRCVGSRVNVGLHISSPGYMERAQCEQDLSAVSTLCAVVRKEAFLDVGGFTSGISTGLYRDVDYCAKTRKEGWRIVWSPATTLMSLCTNADADRPPKDATTLGVENCALLDRWFGSIAHETAFNRNLSRLRSDFQVELNTVPNWDPVIDVLPRVLAFGAGSSGSWEYRAKQPLFALSESGRAQCGFVPFSEKSAVTLPTAIDIENMQPSALVLHNTLHDNYLDAIEQYRRYNRLMLVFGQDDLMFAIPPSNPYSKTVYKDIKKRVRRCMELADRTVVTTEPLANALSEFSSEIAIVPNYLSRALWGGLRSERGTGPRPRVGWAGAQQHGGDLQLLAEVVEATAEEVDWIFFGMCPEVLRRYAREFHKAVPFSQYPARLASLNLDLAVAPLERNSFNEAKSNLRLLEFGALGWPVIASDIHPYREGPICRVANQPAAWVRAIREHVNDKNALARAGDVLREWVLMDWMLEDHLDDWAAVLRDGFKKGCDTDRPRFVISA